MGKKEASGNFASFGVYFGKLERVIGSTGIDATTSHNMLADLLKVCNSRTWAASHSKCVLLDDVWGQAVEVEGLSRDTVRGGDRGSRVSRERVSSDANACIGFCAVTVVNETSVLIF